MEPPIPMWQLSIGDPHGLSAVYTLHHVSVPMTQSIRLRWRPELRFYEERIPILRQFETGGVLQAFRVSEETVDAQLPDWRWLSVTQSGLTLNVLTQADDPSDGWEAIEAVVGTIEPLHYSHARVSYQHVAELPFDEFEVAVDAGHKRLHRQLSTADVTLGDWALLADIAVAGPPSSFGKIEFGIVRDSEVDFRLKGLGGRATGMAHLSNRQWNAQEFKAVSLFADSDLTCRAESGREEAFLGDALAFWRASRAQMSTLVSELRSKLIDNQHGGTG